MNSNVVWNGARSSASNSNDRVDDSGTWYFFPLGIAIACTPARFVFRCDWAIPLADWFPLTRKCRLPLPTNSSAGTTQKFVPMIVNGTVETAVSAVAVTVGASKQKQKNSGADIQVRRRDSSHCSIIASIPTWRCAVAGADVVKDDDKMATLDARRQVSRRGEPLSASQQIPQP